MRIAEIILGNLVGFPNSQNSHICDTSIHLWITK